jgi:hypothetical protein
VIAANASAGATPMRPAGNGLLQVRRMRLSFTTSYTWLRVLAQAAAPKVPRDVHASLARSTFSSLPATKPADAVRATRALSRNLDSCFKSLTVARKRSARVACPAAVVRPR